jgi:curved DNA-binding protein
MGGQPGGFDWSQWMGGAPGGVRVEVGDLGDLFGGGFSDFFTAIFGGTPGTRQEFGERTSGRGRDIEQPVTISLTEAYSGATRNLSRNGKRLEVKIPPGANSGTRVRIPGQGEPGQRQAGDLYLTVEVAPDPRFERKGDDLYANLAVDLSTAVLGGEAKVVTPVGEVVLTIPPGSQPDQTFRLKGRGMPRLRKSKDHGDLYARLKIEIPRELSAREKELFQELASLRRK